ncbi:hypothetical protein Ddye_005269 [Dipteronia dyeriana]|uniref:Protein FAR1-RELATED SEQUENCE n=1 Tax=Dipteronia dyeriana TaxID=168575 RepID=A0AAE0CPJ4_9ROSI|nr:hypothetical protein Ddye_005269 [Dipteronia dyeriana]
MSRMYEMKHRWAEAYLKGHFFTSMETTQRCEGMNNYVKDYVCSHEKLFEFIPQIEMALILLRNNFFSVEYISKCKSPVILSHLKPLEEHASCIYTYQIYPDVAEQNMNESKYTRNAPEEEDNYCVYHLSRYQFSDKKSKVVYHVDRVAFRKSMNIVFGIQKNIINL